MKKKLLKYIGYLFCILLTFSSCVNEMDVIENEQQNLNESRGLGDGASGTWVKYLINYEGSTQDKNSLFKVENLLKNLYDLVPDISYVIDNLIMQGIQFRVVVDYVPGSSKESWHNPNPPEIGFNGDGMIQMERVLHELLHVFSFYRYDSYRKELDLACEEYEIRVLTDLYMRRYFESYRFEYQGMKSGHKDYGSYIDWLDKIISDNNYSVDDFVPRFKEFGISRMFSLVDEKIKIEDLLGYTPLLVRTLWFYKENEKTEFVIISF